MTANMYRVGDCVYFETSSTLPYQIRRIEELNKTPSGNVEAKVMCFYRRRDLPSPLIQLADKHQMAQSEDSPVAMKLKKMWLKTPIGEEPPSQAAIDPTIDGDSVISDLSIRNNSPSKTFAMDEDPDIVMNAIPGSVATGAVASAALSPTGQAPSLTVGTGIGVGGVADKQRHQMKHRELFLSRHVETLPATHIRGKCSVTLLNETESLLSYLNKDDTFFYCLVFDPTQKTLLADKGEIRVGSRYQTEVTNLLKEGEEDTRQELETLVWTPEHGLTDRQIDQFLVVSRSVGTFARALDCSSSVKQPSLHMSAAAASRDITLFHAMDTLHRHTYCMEGALSSLVPPSGPVLCRDEMEEWSASEANLFEEALDKYGKDFNDIRADFLPWKTLKNIIEYYYMWKTTDRYVQQKRVKAVEAESKLKQVYIPNYNKPNPAIIPNKTSSVMNGGTNGSAVNLSTGDICNSCQATSSQQWYAWGPSQLQSRLCSSCWQYWKKYGGFKVAGGVCEGDSESGLVTGGAGLNSSSNANANATTGSARRGTLSGGRSSDGEESGPPGQHSAMSHRPHRCSILNCGKEFKLKAQLARHYAAAHGVAVRAGSPRPVMKTRAAFYLRTSPLTRLARRLSRALRRPRRVARAPFTPVNIHQVKHDCSVGMAGLSPSELASLAAGRGGRCRGQVSRVAERLAGGVPPVPSAPQYAWLRLTPKDRMPQPPKVAFPKPPKAPDGSLMYERIPNKGEIEGVRPSSGTSPSPALKRRAYDDLNGVDRGAGEAGSACPPNSGTASGGIGNTAGVVGSGGGSGGGAGESRCAPPPAKRPNKHPQPMQRPSAEQYAAMCARAQATGQPLPKHIFAHVNGKPGSGSGAVAGSRNRRHVISWMDAPDDLYFRATDQAKVRRRVLSSIELRRAARKPWRTLPANKNVSANPHPPAVNVNPHPQHPLHLVILD